MKQKFIPFEHACDCIQPMLDELIVKNDWNMEGGLTTIFLDPLLANHRTQSYVIRIYDDNWWRKVKTTLTHKFCPFCGKKYEDNS